MKLITTEDEREREEALDLDAQTAGELARGLMEMAQTFPSIACPKFLTWGQRGGAVIVRTDKAAWIIRNPDAPESAEFLCAMIRREFGSFAAHASDPGLAGKC